MIKVVVYGLVTKFRPKYRQELGLKSEFTLNKNYQIEDFRVATKVGHFEGNTWQWKLALSCTLADYKRMRNAYYL